MISSCVPWIIWNVFFSLQYIFFGLQYLQYNTLWPLRLKGTGSNVDFLGVHFENCASGWVLSKRKPRRNIVWEINKRGFHLLFQNLRGASSLGKGGVEETTKSSGFKTSYTTPTALLSMICLPKRAVPYPVLYLECSLVLHMLALRIKT